MPPEWLVVLVILMIAAAIIVARWIGAGDLPSSGADSVETYCPPPSWSAPRRTGRSPRA